MKRNYLARLQQEREDAAQESGSTPLPKKLRRLLAEPGEEEQDAAQEQEEKKPPPRGLPRGFGFRRRMNH